MSNRLGILNRLQELEKKVPSGKVHIFNIYQDFQGPKAMNKELNKAKYKRSGTVIILNDIK